MEKIKELLKESKAIREKEQLLFEQKEMFVSMLIEILENEFSISYEIDYVGSDEKYDHTIVFCFDDEEEELTYRVEVLFDYDLLSFHVETDEDYNDDNLYKKITNFLDKIYKI